MIPWVDPRDKLPPTGHQDPTGYVRSAPLLFIGRGPEHLDGRIFAGVYVEALGGQKYFEDCCDLLAELPIENVGAWALIDEVPRP